MKQVGIIFWVFGCLIQCRIGTVSRIIFGIAWELFDIWTHLTLHKFKEDKQEGLTQQLISDMFLKMTLTLGLQNGRCDDCDETFGFESIFQLFVTATCRKFYSGRAVDEDLFHLFQFISIFVCFRGGSIPGDLWVCQRWKRFGWSTVLRSWCSCHGIDVQKVALRDAEGEQQKSPTVHGCFDASCLAHTIVLVSWSRIEDSGLVFFITRNGSSKFVVFEKNYCIMYGRWNLFQGWNFLQTSSGQQNCICFRNH